MWDLLAVSVGNVHILTKGERGIDLDALARLHHALPDVPLVLHGGTGIGREDIRQAIRLGVVKVNYGTYLKQRYLTAVRRALVVEDVYPHELLGIGGERDVMVAGRLAVRDAVLEQFEFLGCCGKA